MEGPAEFKESSPQVPFEISNLTTSEQGFSVTTDKQLRRRETYQPLMLPPDIKNQLSQDIKGDSRRALEIATGDATFDRQKPLTKAERDKYLDTIGSKLALRNVRQNGDLLIIDIKPVSYWVYQDIAQSSESPQEYQEFAGASGTAAALLTTEEDGSHKMIVQHRSSKNRSYGDVPGASAAGLFDAKFNRAADANRGKLKPINTQDIRRNIFNEIFQEVALDPDSIASLKIVGLARDNVKVHDEFLFFGVSQLSAEEIEKEAAEAPRSKKLGDEYDFHEKFVIIDATPQAIAKLLCEVKCPLPPTHAAAYLAAGYLLVLESQGQDSARFWYEEIKTRCYQNYREIDEMVQRSGKGLRYDPTKFPQDQGLPDFDSEMKRVGLIIDKSEENVSPEQLRTPANAWLFDVDGVITSPETKQISDKRLINELIRRIEANEPVIFVTGRSLEWLEERVLKRIRDKIERPALLKNLYVSAEFGGSYLKHENNQLVDFVDESITVPLSLSEQVATIVESEFSDLVFVDKTKRTMISIEMKEGVKVADFSKRRKELDKRLQELIDGFNLSEQFVVHSDRIATNIRDRRSDKHHAVQQIIKWLAEDRIKPDQFRVFGDSLADTEMASELHSQNLPFEFIFVGGREELSSQTFPFPITFTKGHWDEGTLEYLLQVA